MMLESTNERVENPTHEDITEMLMLMRDQGYAAKIDTDDGHMLITAAARDDYAKSKKKDQKIVKHYRIHDRREGMLRQHRTHDDVLGIRRALESGFEKVENPQLRFD